MKPVSMYLTLLIIFQSQILLHHSRLLCHPSIGFAGFFTLSKNNILDAHFEMKYHVAFKYEYKFKRGAHASLWVGYRLETEKK